MSQFDFNGKNKFWEFILDILFLVSEYRTSKYIINKILWFSNQSVILYILYLFERFMIILKFIWVIFDINVNSHYNHLLVVTIKIIGGFGWLKQSLTNFHQNLWLIIKPPHINSMMRASFRSSFPSSRIKERARVKVLYKCILWCSDRTWRCVNMMNIYLYM